MKGKKLSKLFISAALFTCTSCALAFDSGDSRAIEMSQQWQNNSASPHRGRGGRVNFVHGAGVPTIPCSIYAVCDIELEPGEYVNDAFAGDNVRWHVNSGVSGEGKNATVHIIVKPKEDAQKTNITILTNRRTYHLWAVSTTEHRILYAGFTYPDSEASRRDRLRALQAKHGIYPGSVLDQSATGSSGERSKRQAGYRNPRADVPIAQVSTKFRITGPSKYHPVQVLEDGNEMRIDFKDGQLDRYSPMLIVKGGNSRNYPYTHLKNSYVIKGVPPRVELMFGFGKKKKKIVIVKK